MAVRKPAPKSAGPKSSAPKSVAPNSAAPKPAEQAASAVEAPAPKAVFQPKVEAAPATETLKVEKPIEAAKVALKAAGVDAVALQADLRTAAAKSIEQGVVAYDRLKEAADEATHTLEASFAASSKGAAELAAKALEAVKANANATFDHLKALASSKHIADAVALHGQFIRKQSEAAVAQAKEFAELAKKTATEASAPIQAQLKKPLSPKD
jgi:phasin